MKNKTLNIKGRIVLLNQPIVMGILNATPDSFYSIKEAGKAQTLIYLAEKMLTEGATILDIGGMSTNPKSSMISEEEEWQRLKNPLKIIRKEFPDALLSVDTFRATIAQKAFDEGIDMINDISAGEMDKNMFQTVAIFNIPYIAMHMQGTPQTMQQNPQYEHLTREVLDYFIEKTGKMEAAGIKDIILDPGFGFGKTIAHNYQLLQELNTFQILEKPILAGVSRKSMIYKLLGITPAEALNATTALNMIALQNGADILRVHDVKEAVECIRLCQYMKEQNHFG